MEEWKDYKLGEICTKIGSGATPKGGKEAYLGGDTSLIRSQNVLDFSFSWDGLAYINDEQAAKLNGVEIEKAGDMNCYKGQSGETKRYGIQAIFDLLEEWGFKSAYHQKTGEPLGKESKATYYHQFKEESKFFLDYAFSNVPIMDYRLFEWNKEISDHVGQLIEI